MYPGATEGDQTNPWAWQYAPTFCQPDPVAPAIPS
jgi:hypothetical protein